MQTKYTKTFKIEAVKKVLSRAPDSPFIDIAKTLKVPESTLYGWVQAMKDKKLTGPLTSEGSIEKKPCQWSSEERFSAIIDTRDLSEEQVSEYCRKAGIFPHHLEVWKKEFIEAHSQKQPIAKSSEIRTLREENKKLSKELRRKEKALAEAAALLVLKKKQKIIGIQARWTDSRK